MKGNIKGENDGVWGPPISFNSLIMLEAISKWKPLNI